MLMMNVNSDRPPRAQGIQCGIARSSIVASTGSPSRPVVEQRLEAPHRRIIPHVLVDLKEHAGPLARLDQPRRLAVRQRQRLLRQDAPHPTGMRQHPADHPRLLGRRHGDIHDLDRGVVEHLLQRSIDLRHAPQRGHFLRRRDRPRGDPDHAVRGVGVGHQVAVADDEARRHHADAGVAPLRSLRSMIQVPTRWRPGPFQVALASLRRERSPTVR